MRLYSGTTAGFIDDSVHNRIATKLVDSFFHSYHFEPSHAEVNAWRNSLRAVSQVFESAGLTKNGIIVEFQLPLTSRRLDCLITGRNDSGSANAAIIELKQWEQCEESGGSNEVVTWIGGKKRDVLHPSAQVRQYKTYLQDCHTAFSTTKSPGLHACSYLHNYPYNESDVLFSAKFSSLLKDFPAFTADDVDALINFLRPKLYRGDDGDILQKIENSQYRASKKLLDHVASVIKGKAEYVLLDEQLVVYDRVMTTAEQGFREKKKTVLIVKGGPGTGKSVIALNLLGDLSAKGLNTHFVTGSRAFTTTIREIVGARAGVQIRYFNSYAQAETNDIDVMLCDEAHRIRKTSNSRFTPRKNRSNLPQVEELLKAAKTGVFFIDDDQIVRPGEIGSADYIQQAAQKNRCKVVEYELEAQFRCAGSDAFVNWINNTLGVKKTANVLWNGEEKFDFQIFDSPLRLEETIREKIAQKHTGRLAAGFCWKWSSPLPDGTLALDVKIGNYERAWNAKSDAGHLADGIPRERLWAYDPRGINQIGCIYTAQGFEFDYIGVIFGKDLVYNPEKGIWEGNRNESADGTVRRSKDDFLRLTKNTYRVLLSRGMKGCYVYFMDKGTENFFRSRMDAA